MKPKPLVGMLLIILLLIVATGFIVASGSFSGDIYKVNINGTVYHDSINGWGVTYDGYSTEQDNWLPFWFWSDKVDVQVKIQGAGIYSGSVKIGDYNPVYYEKSFVCPVRWVKPGSYSGTITIWHVVYDDMFGLFEKSRTQVGSTPINDLVVPKS